MSRRTITPALVVAMIGASAAMAQAQDGMDLGLDAAGEACVAVASQAEPGAFDVYCGAWRAPAGAISRNGDLLESCAPSELDAAILTCSGRFSGGALLDAAGSASGRDGEVYYRGLPAAAPTLRRGASALAGAAAPPEFSASVSAELASRGVSALEDLRSLRRRGDSLNIAFAFAEAADAYSLSLTFLDGPFAGRVDQRAEIALELALNLSGEGQFAAAAREFARAGALVAEAGSPTLEYKQENYIAAHLMNQGLFEPALRRLEPTGIASAARGGSGLGGAATAADDEITVEEASAANLRGRSEDGDVEPFALKTGDVLTDEERETLLKAHRAYLRGVCLDILERDGVDQTYGEAADLLNQAPPSSAIWMAALLAEKRAMRDLAAGRPGQAVAKIEPALEAVQALAPRSALEARLTATLAEAIAARGDRDAAIETFAKAFEIFGSIGVGQTGVSVERAGPYLELLLQAHAEAPSEQLLRRYVSAFETIAEPGAAAAMTRAGARASGDVSSREDIRALQDAQLALQQASTRLRVGAAGADAAELAEMRAARDEAEQAVIAAELAVRAQSPDYQQLVSRQVDVDTLAAVLGGDEIFLAYAASSRGGFGYVIRSDGSVTPFTSQMRRGRIADAAADLRESLEESGGGRDVVARAEEIYGATVGAARSALAEAGRDQGIASLIYSARGAVGAVPPAILISGAEADGTPRWLVRDYRSLMSAPSAAAIVAARLAPPRPTPGGMVLFGPPERPSSDALRSLVDSGCADFLESEVFSQPITAISADDVARLGARSVGGEAFTTQQLAEVEDLESFSILVFSTHGFTGAQRCASEPGLLVSAAPFSGEPSDDAERAFRDPLMTASEVVALHLQADLVILAACDTANTGRPGGLAAALGSEHLDGLARAFIYAGARNVLATHWAVDDQATDAFVTRLLSESQSKPLAEAVAATQNYFLENPDALTGGGREMTPALWGGFILLGDGARTSNAYTSG